MVEPKETVLNTNLIPTPSRLFAKQVVPVDPEEMHPFYERDSFIRQHRETIERLKQAKADYDAEQDDKIKEFQAVVAEALRTISHMRQKIKAAKSRIASCIDKKKNAVHNFHIHQHNRAIELRKIEINRRELNKTAKAMANQIFKKMKTKIPQHLSRKLTKPNLPE